MTGTGAYVRLFNGHSIGPTNGHGEITELTFGPFPFVHQDDHGHLQLGDLGTLFYINGQLFYDSTLFADWMVFCGQPEHTDEFKAALARPLRRRHDSR